MSSSFNRDVNRNLIIEDYKKYIEEKAYFILTKFDTNEGYFEIINTKNIYNDPYYDSSELLLLEKIYIFINYFQFEFYELSLIDYKTFEYIRNLIIYQYYNKNNYNSKQYEINIYHTTIKKIEDLQLFKIIDFKDISSIIIDSRCINDNEKQINEIYEDFIIKNNLRKPRFVNKTISKLDFLLESLFGLNIDIENKKIIDTRMNGEKVKYSKYNLFVRPNERKTDKGKEKALEKAEDAFNCLRNIYANFSYSQRIDIKSLNVYQDYILLNKNIDFDFLDIFQTNGEALSNKLMYYYNEDLLSINNMKLKHLS